jgi:hypothetical protein
VTALDLTAFADLGVFTPAAGSGPAKAFYDRWGFVVLRDLVDPVLIDALETECVAAQEGVLAGELDARHGSRKYLDDESKAERFVNYVEHIEELAPALPTALATPALVEQVAQILGPDFWPGRGGVVYQDARPGGAEDGDELAVGDLQVEPIQGAHGGATLEREVLDDPAQGDRGLGVRGQRDVVSSCWHPGLQ